MEVGGAGTVVELNGGTFKADAVGKAVYGVYIKEGGKLIVNKGAVIDTTGSDGAAVAANNTTGYMYAEINGGTLKSKYQTVYMPQQVSLKIGEGSVLEGGIVARMGNIEISGGTINGIVDASSLDKMEDYYSLGNGFPWVGDAIAVMGGTYVNNNDDKDNSLKLTITGGTLTSENGYAVVVYDMGKVVQKMDVSISGGTFKSAEGLDGVSAMTVKELMGETELKAGYGAVENGIDVTVSGGTFNNVFNPAYLAEGKSAYKASEGWTVDADTTLPNLPETILIEKGGAYEIKMSDVAKKYVNVSFLSEEGAAKINRDDFVITGEKAGEASLILGLTQMGKGDTKVATVRVYEVAADDEASEEDAGTTQSDAKDVISSIIAGDSEIKGFTFAEGVSSADVVAAIADGGTPTTAVSTEEIDAEDIDDAVVTAVEKNVTELGEDTVVAGYFDIDVQLLSKKGDKETVLGYLTNLSESITITAKMPESIEKVAEGYTRSYYVVRYHEGVAERLSAVDNGDGTFSFDSDRFSTYALAYIDTLKVVDDEGSDSENGSEGSEGSESSETEAPETGAFTAGETSGLDVTGLVVTVVTMTVAMVAMEVISFKKRAAKK